MGSTAAGDGAAAAGRGGWLASLLGPFRGGERDRAPERGERRFRLVEAGHPIPPGAVVSRVASEGADIRAARWPAPDGGAAPGTVLICTGRSEFIEKYLFVVAELRARGFAVVIFDWRGQGLSQRPLGDAHKGHVDRFSDYEGDLLAVVDQVVEPFCPKPLFGLAHSMGGAIALNAAADHPGLFRRLVLSAPMVEIARLPFAGTARAVARLCRHGGLARSFVPGGRGRSLLFRAFESNLLTSDEARYRVSLDHVAVEPRLALGAPTLGWLHAAFGAMAQLHAPDYPERMTTPVLAVVPGADRVVEPRATERLVSRLRASRVVTVPGSRHEVLMEQDCFRQQFWAAFDAFVPGSG
ncbi:alpha/beta fold hydrolase [Lichenibacterium dinghuense]|uniref:alpha/beta fold hydrolase n=1 Tax=Lichenibacterium dinghuense TaxID=2895977 RepID=UPI001F242AD5|nr:alpha/beta hydrolase [Lichenibacterium sp. 6Y81]